MLLMLAALETSDARDRFTRMYEMHRGLMFHIAGRS